MPQLCLFFTKWVIYIAHDKNTYHFSNIGGNLKLQTSLESNFVHPLVHFVFSFKRLYLTSKSLYLHPPIKLCVVIFFSNKKIVTMIIKIPCNIILFFLSKKTKELSPSKNFLIRENKLHIRLGCKDRDYVINFLCLAQTLISSTSSSFYGSLSLQSLSISLNGIWDFFSSDFSFKVCA